MPNMEIGDLSIECLARRMKRERLEELYCKTFHTVIRLEDKVVELQQELEQAKRKLEQKEASNEQ